MRKLDIRVTNARVNNLQLFRPMSTDSYFLLQLARTNIPFYYAAIFSKIISLSIHLIL